MTKKRRDEGRANNNKKKKFNNSRRNEKNVKLVRRPENKKKSSISPKSKKKEKDTRAKNDEKAQDPDFQKLLLLLKRGKITAEQLIRLVQWKSELEGSGVTDQQFAEAIRLCKRYGPEIGDISVHAKELKALEEEHKKSIGEILQDARSKIEEISRASLNLKEIEVREEELRKSISNLDDLKSLQTNLHKTGFRAEEISAYISDYKKLLELGLDSSSITVFVDQLKRFQLAPKETAKEIARLLSRGKSIEEALARSEHRLEDLKSEETLVTARIETLNRQVAEIQERISNLQNYYATQSRTLERAYEARERAMHARVEDERSSAEAEILGLLRERDRIRGEVRAVKAEAESMQQEMNFARSLIAILRDPNTISSAQLGQLAGKFAEAIEAREKKGLSVGRVSEARIDEARRTLVTALKESVKI